MHIAAAAPDELCRIGLVCQPAATEPPLRSVIAIQVCQNLIGAAEVLNPFPIGPGNSSVCIEACPFDVVAPDAVSGCLKDVGPCLGVVSDIAGLMFVESRGAGISFRRGRDSIDQHVMVEDASLGRNNKLKIILSPGIEIENRRQL